MSTTFVHRNLPRLLLQAREAVMAHTRPSLREHGLSDQQWRVLRVLGEHGVVRRERDPTDQRRTVVEATAKGRKMVERLSHTIEAHYQWLEQTLGKPKLAELYLLLDQLIALEQP
jgi:hypothetical protein